MAINRRKFLTTSALAGGAAGILPIRSMKLNTAGNKDYSKLDKILKEPVLRRELFANPIIIESLELLRDRRNFICRVRSKCGAEGISVGHPFISIDSYPMFNNFFQRQFLGKDARDLDYLIYFAAERMVKRQGNPLSVQIAPMKNVNPLGLFDDHCLMKKLSKLGDPLQKLSNYIDWNIFNAPLDKAFADETKDRSKGGRPPFDKLLLFKGLLVQSLYNLSDDQLEYQIIDRVSFKRFLGLKKERQST
jgi:hypothetical protein